MKNSLYIIESFLYYVSLICISERIFHGNVNKRRSFVSISIAYILLIILGYSLDFGAFAAALECIKAIQILLAFIVVKNIKLRHLVGTYVFVYSINIIASISIVCLFGVPKSVLLIIDFLVNIIFFILCIFLCRNKRFSTTISKILTTLPASIISLIIISFGISALLMSLIVVNPNISENNAWILSVRGALILLVIVICTSFPILVAVVLTNSYLKRQNEIFEHNLEVQANHYIALAKANYELRRFKHDFNNIKIGLSKSVHDNNYDGALAIIQDMDSAMQKATNGVNRFDTGNGIVDAILSDKQAKAKDKHITLDFCGSLPSHSLSPIDLCVIFGNTIDNAIEACERLPMNIDKTIYVRSQCNSGFVFISIENPVERNVKISNNYIETTKAERSAHGYGLYSLNKTVKKYDGDLKLSCENYKFKVEIDLSINSSK